MTHPPVPGYPPPPQPVLPPPPPRNRSRAPLVLVAVAGMLVFLVLLACGAYVLVNRGHLFGAHPDRSASGGPAQPIYRKLPAACDSVPAATVARLVPGAEISVNQNSPGDGASQAPHAVCRWTSSSDEERRTRTSRGLDITFWVYLTDSVSSGSADARREYDNLHSQGQRYAGRTDGSHTYGDVEELTGLGAAAFAQSDTIHSTLHYGGTDIDVLVDNVVLELTYNGSDGPDGQERPMPAPQARQGAETAAREMVQALVFCPDCKS